MAHIKKIDVKNYLSSPKRNGFRLHRPTSQPDATGSSGDMSRRADSNASNVIEETFNRPPLSGMEPQTKTQPDCGQIVTPAKSKSGRG